MSSRKLSFVSYVLIIRRPPRSTHTDPLFPFTTLFRSRRDDILLNGLGMSKISTGTPIKLPQYAALADCEDQLTSIEINQYALKDIIHVQGVAGRLLKPPFHFAAGRIDG